MGFARFLSSLMATFLTPYDLGVFRFVCFIEIRNRCAINVICYGHFARECPNVVFFNCDNLGHISKECPDSPRCCICKFLNHLAINCEYSWGSSVINSAGVSSCHNSSITDTKSNASATQMDVEDSSNVSAPAASDAVVLVHVPDPVKPQQSEPLLSSQPATFVFWCWFFYLQSCSTVFFAIFDRIADSTFFQFIVSAVHKDQSSQI